MYVQSSNTTNYTDLMDSMTLQNSYSLTMKNLRKYLNELKTKTCT